MKVVDEQCAVVSGATASITSSMLVARRINGVTNAGGTFAFTSLPTGVYTVQIELQSFQTIIHDNVVVSVG